MKNNKGKHLSSAMPLRVLAKINKQPAKIDLKPKFKMAWLALLIKKF